VDENLNVGRIAYPRQKDQLEITAEELATHFHKLGALVII